MNLNIWVIQEWLKACHPVSTIADGTQEIEGIRFFSSFREKDERHIYICRARDLLSGSSSDEVLLSNGNDVISLRSTDIEDIFTRVTECFEYYNNWEKTLFACAKLNHPEQCIVDACNKIFGPIFILDLKSNLIAYSRNYRIGEVNSIWDEYIALNKVTLKTLYQMNSCNYTRLAASCHHCLVFEEPKAAPYSHGIMISYCDRAGNLVGQCTISSNHPMSPRDVCLAKTFEAAILSIRDNRDGGFYNFAQSILLEMLTTGILTEYDRSKLLDLTGWREDIPFRILLIGMSDLTGGGNALLPYLSSISTDIPDCVGLIFHDRLVFCIQTEESDNALLARLNPVLDEIPLKTGVSNSFEDLSQMQVFYQQAAIALKRGTKKAITFFREYALDTLAHEADRNFCRYCLHPTVVSLIKYDKDNHTEYGLTLRAFLRFERSYQLAAQALFIHRNTVLYRLERIQELYPTDLGDPEEREYLLYSFRFLD